MTRERKKSEKRAAILQSAFDEFKNRRFDAVKLDDVAARAGVGKGTLYLYFKNKEDLFIQMALDGVEQMAGRMKEIARMDLPFCERFFLFGREIGAFVEKRSVMFRLMHQISSESIQQEFMGQHRLLVEVARGLLKAGVDEGVLRSDVTVADLHCLLIGPLLFRVRLNKFNNDQIEVNTLLNLFWDAAVLKPETRKLEL
ncbi:MAG: TetR/AcrR family transcriptional regulator [Kiritimatiellales bacterium]|nr:TetR/AcrR family transcriptional regulator [Kiritimatiellota bacterium]MBL7012115.1 TetR/AcrR family transcriptional regulator [Kiritimatiellales bacterium]